MEINPATGKPKKVLDEYIYDLGSCTYCQLCVNSCPHNAIEFRNTFENAVFNRAKLVLRLDPVVAPKPAEAAPESAAAKTEEKQQENN